MNQRIDQLWAQALDAAVPETYTRLSHSQVLKIKQVFAELIVQECFEHCKGQLVDKKTAEHMGLTYNDAVGDCANGLLQHFGVEE
jgi:hypothetical protein